MNLDKIKERKKLSLKRESTQMSKKESQENQTVNKKGRKNRKIKEIRIKKERKKERMKERMTTI